MQHKNVFTKGILAGILIGLAGTIYLSVDNKILGSVLFSFGLMTILYQGYYLYTGKIGYLVPSSFSYLKVILKTLAGNAIGLFIIALLVKISNLENVIVNATNVFEYKIDKTWHVSLSLSALCGMVMYIICDTFKYLKSETARVAMIVFGIVIFILAGFEHSIANLYYLFVSGSITLKGLLYIFIMIIGNAIGANLLNLLKGFSSKNEE